MVYKETTAYEDSVIGLPCWKPNEHINFFILFLFHHSGTISLWLTRWLCLQTRFVDVNVYCLNWLVCDCLIFPIFVFCWQNWVQWEKLRTYKTPLLILFIWTPFIHNVKRSFRILTFVGWWYNYEFTLDINKNG